jgi:hypothetical protein
LKIGKILTDLLSSYRSLNLLMQSLIGACKAVEVAWQRIDAWPQAESSAESGGSTLVDQLLSSIEVGMTHHELGSGKRCYVQNETCQKSSLFN